MLDFTIDSGAADISIRADVFSTLTRTGTIEPAAFLPRAFGLAVVIALYRSTAHTANRPGLKDPCGL
jgi:hypothetical protein